MKQSTRSIFVILLSTMIMLSACNSKNTGTTNKPSQSESGTAAWSDESQGAPFETQGSTSETNIPPETTPTSVEDTTPNSLNYTSNNNLAAGGIACNTEYGVIFTNAIKGLHKYSEMMRIDDDGSKKAIAGYPAKYINYDGEDVYFCSNYLFNYYLTDRIGYWGIHRKISSQNLQLLYPGNAKFLVLCGEYLYFCDYLSKPSNETTGQLTKINKDGTGLTILSESQCSFLNIVNNWIYYIADNTEIRKISLSGENEQTILDGITAAENLNYENGYLYWVEKADSKIVRMKTDGTGREDVVQDRITAFIINNATLYYLNSKEPDSDGVIRGMKLIALEIFTRRTREFDLPYGMAAEDISLIGNWLYMYIEPGESVESAVTARINVESGEVEVLDDISYKQVAKITVEEMAQYFDMGKCWSFGGFETDTGHYYNVFSNPGKGTGGCAYVNPYNGNIFYGTEKDLIYFSTSTYNISGNPDRIDSNVELLINNFISVLKNDNIDGFKELIHPSGLVLIRNFCSGNGTRGKDIRNHYTIDDFPSDLQFPIEAEIPVVPYDLFMGSINLNGQNIKQITVKNESFTFLDSSDNPVNTYGPSTSDVREICERILNKSNIINDEPAVFILGDEEIALAESTSNFAVIGSWAIFVKYDYEYYLRALMDFR